MADKIYIGTIKQDIKSKENTVMYEGEKLWLEKHNWDCDWYWGFGYIGNRNLHTHFDNVFLKGADVASDIFVDPIFTDSQWWIIRDLFVQAYSLKKCAETYRYGGHQTTMATVTDIIKDQEMADRLNADCEKVLNKLWEFMEASKTK